MFRYIDHISSFGIMVKSNKAAFEFNLCANFPFKFNKESITSVDTKVSVYQSISKFNKWEDYYLNPFLPNLSFLYPVKTSKNPFSTP